MAIPKLPSGGSKKPATSAVSSSLSEQDILDSRKSKPKPVADDSSVTEEAVQRAGDVRDKNKRLQKAAKPVYVPETHEDEREVAKSSKKKTRQISDADEKEIAKNRPTVSDFVSSFAKEVGCKVATDILGSDVAHWYPFGCAPIDIILGGGIPSGKIIEWFGWESSGKSTLTLEAAKAFTRYWSALNEDNYLILWIESESAMDKVRAQYMGCDLSRFAIEEAETVEDGFATIEKALKWAKEKGTHLLISWDTIAAVLTANEKSDNEFAGGMGEKARLIRRKLKDVSTLLGHTSSTLCFVNQMYKTFEKFGEKDQVPGGGGIKFHASIRCLMTKHSTPIEQVLPTGQKISKAIDVDLYTKKNKLTLPYQTCKIIINNESGLDVIETLSRFLVLHKYIDIRGGWKYIKFNDYEYKFQNMEQLRELLEIKTPELKTYMDYLCYLHYANISPLMKVKLLDTVWKYEIQLFGDKRTKISDEEFSLASLLGRSLLEKQDRESVD